MSGVLQVFVFRSGQYVGSEVFAEPEIVIGSGEGVGLLISEPGVSPQHAVLNHGAGQATLLDLGASGETRVNRAPIKHCYVTPRDEIQIGSFTLKIKFVQAAATQPPAPMPAPSPAAARPQQPVQSLDALIDDELSSPLDVGGADVLSSEDVDAGAFDGALEFGSLDDALNSAFAQSEPSPPIPAPPAPPDASQPSPAPSTQTVTAPPSSQRQSPTFAEVPTAPTESVFARELESDLFTGERGRANTSRDAAPSADPFAPLDDAMVAELEVTPARTADAQPEAMMPSSVPERDDDEEKDPEELEAETPPGFSLVDQLIQEGNVRSGRGALELICYDHRNVHAATLLTKKGERVVLGRRRERQTIPAAGMKGLPFIRLLDGGKAEVRLPASAEGFVSQHGNRVAIEQLKTPDRAVGKRSESFKVPFAAGSQMAVNVGDTRFFLRFVDPPKVKEAKHKVVLDKLYQYALAGSVATHLMAAVVVGLSSSGVTFSEPAVEEWTEVQQEEIREVEVEPPPPPEPEPEPEPEPQAPPPEPERKPQPKPKPKRRPPPQAKPTEAPPKGAPEKKVKKAGVLGAMGKLNLAAPGKKAMVQAVSNIDAVKTPGGSNYRVGALVGKTPSSKLSVGGGGGGKLLTRGSSALLKGGSGLAKIGKKGGSVRGKVSRASGRRLQAQGSISQADVLKVINSHLSEVQYCYEKNLLKDPSLKGKIALEWTIGTNGSVSRVRQKSSSMRSPEVAGCIMQSIKRWRFPKPKGGVVIISYPFVFSQSSF